MAKNLGNINVKVQLDELDPELSAIIYRVLVEMMASHERHGVSYDMHHGYAVLLEEVEGAWDEIKKDNDALAAQEMIRVAAMALKFIMTFMPEAEMSRGAMKNAVGSTDERPAAVDTDLGDDGNH